MFYERMQCRTCSLLPDCELLPRPKIPLLRRLGGGIGAINSPFGGNGGLNCLPNSTIWKL